MAAVRKMRDLQGVHLRTRNKQLLDVNREWTVTLLGRGSAERMNNAR